MPVLTYRAQILKICACLQARFRLNGLEVPISRLEKSADFILNYLIIAQQMEMAKACQSYYEAVLNVIK